MSKKKSLYLVSIPDISFPSECFYAFILAFNECNALNLLIRKLDEIDGISLDRLDLSHREIYQVPQFIK